jgi:hypothetical protein
MLCHRRRDIRREIRPDLAIFRQESVNYRGAKDLPRGLYSLAARVTLKVSEVL